MESHKQSLTRFNPIHLDSFFTARVYGEDSGFHNYARINKVTSSICFVSFIYEKHSDIPINLDFITQDHRGCDLYRPPLPFLSNLDIQLLCILNSSVDTAALLKAQSQAGLSVNRGVVVQLVRAPPCHGGSRGFESRQSR